MSEKIEWEIRGSFYGGWRVYINGHYRNTLSTKWGAKRYIKRWVKRKTHETYVIRGEIDA